MIIFRPGRVVSNDVVVLAKYRMSPNFVQCLFSIDRTKVEILYFDLQICNFNVANILRKLDFSNFIEAYHTTYSKMLPATGLLLFFIAYSQPSRRFKQ